VAGRHQYTARHVRRTRSAAPLATAAAVTVAVVGTAVGLVQAAPQQSAKSSPAEPQIRQTDEPVSRSTTRPSTKPKPSAKRTRTVLMGTCRASYYDEPQGTASGEQFDPEALTAAHKTWKMGTRVRVTNPRNGKSVIVRINDRGPYVPGRCLDLSRAAFRAIEDLGRGVMPVRYEVLS
jgi:rare lipoprotein A